MVPRRSMQSTITRHRQDEPAGRADPLSPACRRSTVAAHCIDMHSRDLRKTMSVDEDHTGSGVERGAHLFNEVQERGRSRLVEEVTNVSQTRMRRRGFMSLPLQLWN